MGENQLIDLSEDKSKSSQNSNSFNVLVSQAMGSLDAYKPTKEQVDKMLSLEEKSMDYTLKDRSRAFEQLKFESRNEMIYFFSAVLLILGIMVFQPNYTSQAISLLFGGLGGYGFASQKQNKSNGDE